MTRFAHTLIVVVSSILLGLSLNMAFAAAKAHADISDEEEPITRTRVEQIMPDHPRPPELVPVDPLPRIGVRDGEGEWQEWRVFYNTKTGEQFHPEGYNHTILGMGNWHATFNVGQYDPEAMEDTLSHMAELGSNIIRLWAWGENVEGEGVTGLSDSHGLNAEYMSNFIDFLQRATRHGVYVIAIFDRVPTNAYYDSIVESADNNEFTSITGVNRQYLAPGLIAAKGALAADFIRYIKEADEGLLNTVFSWQLANESNIHSAQGPFMYREGHIMTANGKTYDMSDKDSRQACWDDGIVHWTNELTAAIKEVDPNTFVNVGFWTADAHGREPYNGLLDPEPDPRIPPRPSVLVDDNCSVDFISASIYPWGDEPIVRPEAHEWEAVKASGIPTLAQEYGARKRKTLETAADHVIALRDQFYAMGYQGSLFWSWNLEQPGTYNAHHGNLMEVSAPKNSILR